MITINICKNRLDEPYKKCRIIWARVTFAFLTYNNEITLKTARHGSVNSLLFDIHDSMIRVKLKFSLIGTIIIRT